MVGRIVGALLLLEQNDECSTAVVDQNRKDDLRFIVRDRRSHVLLNA
jgi:hypothetical protein